MRRFIAAQYALALVMAVVVACSAATPTATAVPSASASRPVAGATPPPAKLANGSEAVLLTASAVTASAAGNAVSIGNPTALFVQLDVTAASGTTPTLDVKIQTTEDGTNWCDFAAAAQATAVSRQVIRVVTTVVPNTAQVACTDATLAAATVHQGPIGRSIRVKYVIGGTTPSFTFTVKAWVVD